MNYCWETPLSCQGKPLESRDACGSQFIPIKPGHRTHQIHRSGNPKMLQVRFGKADRAGAAHAKGAHSLPKSSLRSPLAAHTAWQRLASKASDELLGALHVGQTARIVMVRRLYFFSERIQWTWLGQRPQSVVENLILITSWVRLSMAGVQLILRCPRGANGRLPFPIDEELTSINALLRVGLPLHIETSRTNHFDP
jgi:hypothetical protein